MVPSDSEESPLSQQRAKRKASVESIYFTPIPCETRSQLESSASFFPDDILLDSGRKTRSARRRTTINITMTDVSRGPQLGECRDQEQHCKGTQHAGN